MFPQEGNATPCVSQINHIDTNERKIHQCLASKEYLAAGCFYKKLVK